MAAAALGAGCGGSSGGDGGHGAAAESRPAPPASEFPSASGRTLRQVMQAPAVDGPSELVVSPVAMVFYAGENRYPFGVFERDGTQVPDAKVGLYFARVPTPMKKKKGPAAERERGREATGGKSKGAMAAAQEKALDQPAVGPFPAAIETLQTQPAFRARTTVQDPDAATLVYSTNVDFPEDGDWRIAALIEDEGEMTATLLPSAVVGEFKRVPRPGEKAPLIHTPTAADVNGDLSKITTRIPPDTQNRVDYAEVLGKKPIVLLFATPKFCQSRVCGPVVDVAEQLKEQYGDRVAFIHMEIYNENNPAKGTRPQVRAFHLPTEPWAFVINRHGIVSSAIEGAFGVEELTRAIKKVLAA